MQENKELPNSSIVSRLTLPVVRQRLDRESANADRVTRILSGDQWNFHGLLDKWVPRILRYSGMLARGKKNAVKIEVLENIVCINDLSNDLEGYRILHISDLHADISKNAIDKLIELLPSVAWDICVITGDFRGKTWGEWDSCCEVIKPLLKKLDGLKFGILGNHDTIHLASKLEEMGLRMLLNEGIEINRGDANIWLAGVDDPHLYQTHRLDLAMKHAPQSAVKILLAHSTDPHQQANSLNVDLMLCGHTHGGQICLPFGVPVLTSSTQPRKMASGKWFYNRMQGYTSRGVGTSNIDARFNCAPEITVHLLKNG